MPGRVDALRRDGHRFPILGYDIGRGQDEFSCLFAKDLVLVGTDALPLGGVVIDIRRGVVLAIKADGEIVQVRIDRLS